MDSTARRALLLRVLLALPGVVACRPYGSLSEQRAGAPLGSPAPPSYRWVAYDSAGCGVRVDFPGVPVVTTTEVATDAGARFVENGTFELPGTRAVVIAACADLGSFGASAEGIMDAAQVGMLARTGARLLEERPSIGGRELRLGLRGHEVWARVMTVGADRLLTLVVAPSDAFSENDARRFLDSPRAAPHAVTPRLDLAQEGTR